ncbi:hypothetical protein [Paenibacillus ehimensis]|uniref:hypothetical protein n=1 Tax=Paenibacillus ehimensis TaxID=79264 RepID=UPI002DBCE4DC|nr:hypothetical protein [Paenibacillus ehimensis]
MSKSTSKRRVNRQSGLSPPVLGARGEDVKADAEQERENGEKFLFHEHENQGVDHLVHSGIFRYYHAFGEDDISFDIDKQDAE